MCRCGCYNSIVTLCIYVPWAKCKEPGQKKRVFGFFFFFSHSLWTRVSFARARFRYVTPACALHTHIRSQDTAHDTRLRRRRLEDLPFKVTRVESFVLLARARAHWRGGEHGVHTRTLTGREGRCARTEAGLKRKSVVTAARLVSARPFDTGSVIY